MQTLNKSMPPPPSEAPRPRGGRESLPWLVKLIESKGLLPRISDTERAALEAGTVWLDGDIFSGRLEWHKLMDMTYPQLTEKEKAFLDGPCETLCHMLDEWEITRTRVIPPQVWQYLKSQGFFGLLIPEQYGGRGFSALCASSVFGKIASRSFAVTAVVLVPNSLGPAELLWHYGTQAQRDKYLPALAKGEEVPCFALTEPEAGSDAASITSSGTVFKKDDGSLWLRLNWRKRYITLAPIATLIGLACKLQDPEKLLGDKTDLGITAVLVPANTAGVEIGRRHDPMGLALPNGPTEGHNVEIPVDQIIGGPAYAGKGWRMLMDCLSAGRSVSLPGQSAGGAKFAARLVGAYAGVRKQFGTNIGRFEGIEEPLARIGGFAYMMEAARIFTCGAVDEGHKPSVISAVMKYMETEMVRKVFQDTMDVMGGAALCRGPRNLVAQAPAAAAVGITVEGANILTRTLIMFGQGAMRCHPYAQKELAMLGARDGEGFLRTLQQHMAYFTGNIVKSIGYYFTGGPQTGGPDNPILARYFRRIRWASTQFAVLVDLALMTLGARLKAKGHLSGRFADVLSWIFMGLATLRRYEAEGREKDDLPLVQWSLEHCLWQIQIAMEGIWQNFPLPVLSPVCGALGRLNPIGAPPNDALTAAVARILTTPGPVRDRLTQGLHHPAPDDAMAQLEEAFVLNTKANVIEGKVRKAMHKKLMPSGPVDKMLDTAVAANFITEDDAKTWRRAQEARKQVIEVDSFDTAEYFK